MIAIEKTTVYYNGANINVYINGSISKNAFVFVHGNSLDALTFQSQFDFLKDLPFIAIDLPGHGLSAPSSTPKTQYSLTGYTKLLDFIINHFKMENYIMVGHSLGGHICIEAMPLLSSVKGLFIFGTPPLEIPLALDKAFLPNPNISFLLTHNLSDNDISKLCADIVKVNYRQTIKDKINATDGNARYFFGLSIAEGEVKNEIEIIQNLKFPVAIIHGENDSLVDLKYIENLKFSNLWLNKIHVIAGASHSPQIDSFNEFNQLLYSYYKAILN